MIKDKEGWAENEKKDTFDFVGAAFSCFLCSLVFRPG